VPEKLYLTDGTSSIVSIPYFAPTVVVAGAAILPFARMRFSLRAMLIATTVLAVVLGLAVSAGR
jgi:hypothetical protein